MPDDGSSGKGRSGLTSLTKLRIPPIRAQWRSDAEQSSKGRNGRTRGQAPRTGRRDCQRGWRISCMRERKRGARRRMDNFLQQLINGMTLGSIYGLIAIGYTMVFGIIGMVNFAHGDVFMLSAFIALLVFLFLTKVLGLGFLPLAFIHRAARRHGADLGLELDDRAARLSAAARLVPAGAADLGHRHVDLPVEFRAGRRRGRATSRCRRCSPRSSTSFRRRGSRRHAAIPPDRHRRRSRRLLLVGFWWLVQKTNLGRAQRACEQDRKMAALIGVDVDRTISITFVIGAALAAVAGAHVHALLRRGEFLRRLPARREGVHRRGAGRHRLAARRGARRADDRPDRGAVGGLFLVRTTRTSRRSRSWRSR